MFLMFIHTEFSFIADKLSDLNQQPYFAGWGQTGASNVVNTAGHDINYMALTGILSAMRRKDEAPLAPLNLVADFGGGGLMCAMGILLALIQRQHTSRGQVWSQRRFTTLPLLLPPTSFPFLEEKGTSISNRTKRF
jgi:hypothetical protein